MSERGRPRSFDRDKALERAMEVFEIKGYDGASMTDLTRAMGINSPSLYAAFGCKEALFCEAVELYAQKGAFLWEGIFRAPTAKAAIAHLLRQSAVAYTRPDKAPGCLILMGVLHGDDDDNGPLRMLRKHRAGNHRTLCERLERAVAEGELPQGLDCAAVASFYLAVQQGIAFQSRDGVPRETLLRVAESALAGWDGLISAHAVREPEMSW
ncbi:TetR family transcriptional regulator [Brucella endophytica]|uniref:TetR family transcriptional regulator n=1 Tax=Brucella endophytica TaxID=1963359 RepID=A0A916RZJ8_9HYPH|nr:TetR/AcrR family transcriptional regulator [Brucella endophytica]GGA77148.1 TetR family transcriptional regulator [Brucella endophytica]